MFTGSIQHAGDRIHPVRCWRSECGSSLGTRLLRLRSLDTPWSSAAERSHPTRPSVNRGSARRASSSAGGGLPDRRRSRGVSMDRGSPPSRIPRRRDYPALPEPAAMAGCGRRGSLYAVPGFQRPGLSRVNALRSNLSETWSPRSSRRAIWHRRPHVPSSSQRGRCPAPVAYSSRTYSALRRPCSGG